MEKVVILEKNVSETFYEVVESDEALKPFKKYQCEVSAINEAGIGSSSVINVTTLQSGKSFNEIFWIIEIGSEFIDEKIASRKL